MVLRLPMYQKYVCHIFKDCPFNKMQKSPKSKKLTEIAKTLTSKMSLKYIKILVLIDH